MVEYETVTLPTSGKRVRIPVDSDGYVPASALVAHSQSRGRRYAENDYDRAADIVLPQKLTPEQAAAWWADMDKYDIEGIDVKGRPQNDIGGRTGKNGELHKQIHVYGTPSEEKQVRKMVDDSFTNKEKEKIVSDGGMNITVRPVRGANSGLTDCKDNIWLDRQSGMETGTVIHEGSHVLRNKDPQRDSEIVRSANRLGIRYTGKSKSPTRQYKQIVAKTSNIEESCTVAEQMARQKNMTHKSGYYSQVQVRDRKTGKWREPTMGEMNMMIAQDRKLFTNGTNRGLTEDAAVRSVEKNWSRSHIARLKSSGSRSMAINDMAAATGKVDRIPGKRKAKTSARTSPVIRSTSGPQAVFAEKGSSAKKRVSLGSMLQKKAAKITSGAKPRTSSARRKK